MQTRSNMISFCVLGLPPSHRAPSKKVVIELYSSYQDISRIFAHSNCTSIASYSQMVSNQYTLSELSNGTILNGNINVYGRTINESGHTYLCLIYYTHPSLIHSFKKCSNLQLLDQSISTFIHLLTHNKPNVSINVLKNIQSGIDLLSSVNAQYSRDSRDLVYWDNRCKTYTKTITNCTANKQPISSTAYSQMDTYYAIHDPNDPPPARATRNYNHNQRRYGVYLTDSQYTKRQRYSDNHDHDHVPYTPRSKSYYASTRSSKHLLSRPEYKWSRKSTTDIMDVEPQKEEKQPTPLSTSESKPSKYDDTLTEITKDFTDLSQLVADLQLNTKEEEDDDDEEETQSPNDGVLNTELLQSSIQQSVTAKIDDEDPNLEFVSNATVVIHADDLKEREEDKETLNETDQERRSRARHRRSKPSHITRTVQTNMSDTLMEFHLKCKKAGEIKKKLITRLKTLLNEVETEVLPFDDEDESESMSGGGDDDSAGEATETIDTAQLEANQAKLQKLKILCASFEKIPSNRMAQSGIAEGLVLMKTIFETCAASGEHVSLYNQLFSKMIKHVPYSAATPTQHGLSPLLSPSASTSTASSLSDVISSRRPYSTTQTPFNTPINMSRSTSTNSPTQSTPVSSLLRIGSGGLSINSDQSNNIQIFDEDFASNIPIRKAHVRGGHHRSRSSVEEVMNECDDALKQHFHDMMGTIGDDAAFKEKLKHLLVEVANNYAKDDEDDEPPQPMDSPIHSQQPQQSNRKRQSLHIQPIKNEFVSEMIRIERDDEMEDKYWKALSWNFDPISFGEHVKVAGNTVVLLGWHFIRMNGWHTQFKMTPHKLIAFLYQIQEAYHQDNWYHNRYHAADVMNNMYWFVTECASIQPYLDEFDRFICVMAAALHDVDHNGYNNSYHQRTKSYLAIRYNDQSILENHHISYSFKLISADAHYNWISDLKDTALIERARKYLIRLILGTDMSLHKKHLKQIETLSEKIQNWNAEDKAKGMEEEDKINLLSIILHAADISNAAKARSLCVEWAKRCIEEFRVQGEDEKRLFGKESQLLFDRKHPLEKSQVGWIKFVMLPYFEPLNKLLNNDMETQINYLQSNLKEWTKYKEYTDDEKTNKHSVITQ